MAALDQVSTETLADMCRQHDLLPRLVYLNPLPEYPFTELLSVLSTFSVLLLLRLVWHFLHYLHARVRYRRAQKRRQTVFEEYQRHSEQLCHAPRL